MTDKIKLKGTARAILKHDDGRVEVIEDHNMIVNAGFDFIIASLINSSDRPNPLTHIAIGTGTTAAAATQTALVNEYSRKAGTWSWTAGSKTFTITAEWSRGEVLGTITESAVFNASSNGTMFDRIVFSTPFTGAADIQYTQQFEFEVA